MAKALVLELLRQRTLEVRIVRAAVSKRALDGIDATGIDRFDVAERQSVPMQRVTEHGERLEEMVDQHPPALQAAPGEIRLGPASDQKESVAAVDLREVHDIDRLAALERGEARRHRRLRDIAAPVRQTARHRALGRRQRIRSLRPSARR